MTIVAGTNPKIRGGKTCLQLRQGRNTTAAFGVGVVDDGIAVHERQIVVCGCICGAGWCGVERRDEGSGRGGQMVLFS